MQHPAAFRAVVSLTSAIYDMLRVELTPAGGVQRDRVRANGGRICREILRRFAAYSPYHHVEEGTKYPAVLLLTGANDPRVDPYNSRKMTARLQAASTSGQPVLLRTSGNTGHGIGTPLDEVVEEVTDVDAFLMDQLGMRLPN